MSMLMIVECIGYSSPVCLDDSMTGVPRHHVRFKDQEVILHLYTIYENAFNTCIPNFNKFPLPENDPRINSA